MNDCAEELVQLRSVSIELEPSVVGSAYFGCEAAVLIFREIHAEMIELVVEFDKLGAGGINPLLDIMEKKKRIIEEIGIGPQIIDRQTPERPCTYLDSESAKMLREIGRAHV